MLIGADHNNWRNLVQSGVHPPLFAKGYSLGWQLIAHRFEKAIYIYIYIDGPRNLRRKDGRKKAKERSGSEIEFPPRSFSLVTQPLLCVPQPSLHVDFVAFATPRKERRCSPLTANLARSSNLSELVHRRERNQRRDGAYSLLPRF